MERIVENMDYLNIGKKINRGKKIYIDVREGRGKKIYIDVREGRKVINTGKNKPTVHP